MELIGNIIVGILAFVGAYLGTKSIKKHLIDNYIEDRVTKAQKVNDVVLLEARDIISSFEQTYIENKLISEEELNKIINQCRELSKKSEDAGKEVCTVCYLLYHTVKNLKPQYQYKNNNEESFEKLTLGDVVNLVDKSLRLIVSYCTSSAPIPFSTRLIKRSVIKRSLRKYLKDTMFYGLKHQPFGLTLEPNSEIILRYAEIVNRASAYVYSRNLFLFLQNNIPMVYLMVAKKIYMPLILDKKQKEEGILFDNYKMHLIKISEVKSFGIEAGDYVEFYYSNLSLIVNFVKNLNINMFTSEFTNDVFLNEKIQFDESFRLQKKLNETIVIKVRLDIAKRNFKKRKWLIKYRLYKNKFTH